MRDKEKVVLKEIVNYANKFKFPEHSHILTDNFFNESKFPREITRAILGVLAEKGYIKYITSPPLRWHSPDDEIRMEKDKALYIPERAENHKEAGSVFSKHHRHPSNYRILNSRRM